MAKGFSRTQLAAWAVSSLLETPKDKKKIVEQLAAYLISTKRIHELDLLVNDIARALQSATGLVVAEVVTARPMDAATEKNVSAHITAQTGASQVEIINLVDESLRGGAIIKTPDAEQDLSVRGALQRLTALAA